MHGSLIIEDIAVEVIHKDIRHLYIRIVPPLGTVRVTAPRRMDEAQVRRAVTQRLPWIRMHQARLLTVARQPPRELVTGERHDVWGVPHEIVVTERPGRGRVTLQGDRLHLTVPERATREQRLQILESWQRAELRSRLAVLIPQWEAVVGRTVSFWGVRRMRTRWGSCNPGRGRVWFNLELTTRHPRCLEYVVVHELVHLLERHHNARFWSHLDWLLPTWRQAHQELRRSPSAAEDAPVD